MIWIMTSCCGIIAAIFCVSIMRTTAQLEGVFEVLDLAEQAFDDQYLGCREAVEQLLEEHGILEAEKANNYMFRRAWREAERAWNLTIKNSINSSLPEGFHDHHGIALVAYTGFIRDDFNQAVKSGGGSYKNYRDNFHYKALHYYVTVAIQLLSQGCKDQIQILYRGFEDVFYKVADNTTEVKFGHFLHVSSDEDQALNMGNSTFLTVYSCSGVQVEEFSQFPHEKEVVFPGSEVFLVREFPEDGIHQFSLASTGKQCSNFNCAYILGEATRLRAQDCITSGETPGMSTGNCKNSAPPGSVPHWLAVGVVTALITVVTVF
ncbi:ecto-ADP-ribosyltransferase 5-like [Hyperolius riggenbachi]|uniref:ecto-ADP-ribosyltransferase 5-like n=1 Tax=Hyperolius riggenbachi TaxID=752182 RepID=UPI0035A3C225